jgi:hypothetical protein
MRLWRWFLRHVVGVYVDPTPRERLFTVIGRSEISRITRAQAQIERPSL